MRKTLKRRLPLRTLTGLCLCAFLAACLCAAAWADDAVLPAGLTRIEDELFYKNKKLEDVVLKAPLAYIGHLAFAKSSVANVYIPDSVTLIEDDAFDDCPNLVCYVSEDSYAREWCDAHDIPWEDTNQVVSIEPEAGEILLKNGAEAKIRVEVEPEEAAKSLVWTSSDETILTVERDGVVFGNYPGEAVLTISTRDGQVSAEVEVTVQASYRAVLFSESTYGPEGTFNRNRGDVKLMKEALSAVAGPDGGKYEIHTFDNLTSDEVFDNVERLLITPSRDGDVSLFFFASHGNLRGESQEWAGCLWCRDRATWIQLPVLAEKLTDVNGKVIVILQACGPGAAVTEFDDDGMPILNSANVSTGAEEDPDALAAAAVSSFAAKDPGLRVYRPGAGLSANAPNLFLTEKFIVMAASDYRQMSYFSNSDSNNIYPLWMSRGIGTSAAMPADLYDGDGNGELTVRELHQYVFRQVKDRQTPRVYPENCDYVLFRRAP